ncbi:MAG: hypothetical protein VX871_05820 [Pseudomonadota bacterium]|nr:hypothetical protein [Pseudomonadota bacterium]
MLRATLAAVVVAFPFAAASAPISIDMRKCPLDTVSFIDPWGGAEFEVQKVATDHYWLCPSGEQFTDPKGSNPECVGPYGDLLLKGQFRANGEGTEAKPVTLIYSVIKAVPCCAWNLTEQGEASLALGKPQFRWRMEKDMPLLGDYPFATIEPEDHSGPEIGQVINNPLIALKCRLPAPQ